MSEYLTYTLWQQREQRMPHELEHQRVIEERLLQQEQDARLAAATEAEVGVVGAESGHEYVLVDE
ncbi:MAG: hypothetical protein WED09_10545 [Homoserinimonas sp.]